MLGDFRTFDKDKIIEADICLIGAGAAGITIARELAGSNVRVCLVESGGLELDMDTQALYEIDNVGLPRNPQITSRLRFFGGTTNHWDGRCSPLNEIDFQQRPWVPHSGWPITRKDLDPYYERAHKVCELGQYIYDERVLDQFRIPDPNLDLEKLRIQLWQFSPPTYFGVKYRAIMKDSSNIQVLLHANVTNIQSNAASTHIEHVDIMTLDGKSGKVKAKKFVLCCGGIENARLLLLSNRVESAGLGNRHDLVGRFFMEHLRSKDTVVLLSNPNAMKRIFNEYQSEKGHYLLGFRLGEDIQAKEGLVNGGAMTYFEDGEDSATRAAVRIAKQAKDGHVPDNFQEDIVRVMSDLDEIVLNTRRHFLLPGSSTLTRDMTVLVIETEQTPNPDSRISLSAERDALGLPRSKVDWRLSELDRHTTETMTRLLATELARLYQARVRIPEWVSDRDGGWAYHFKDVAHQMGTTRMADDPKAGVVDRQCRVHGVDNLYIAGSSVFATSGQVNPTLTIVALALRLSDHLKGDTA